MWDPTRVSGRISGGRRISIHGSRVLKFFSIYSRVGPDGYIWSASPTATPISIHGSRVGPDNSPIGDLSEFEDFNPRVPCGTRHTLERQRKKGMTFQSTGPVWDPTLFALIRAYVYMIFQSTGPVWDPTFYHVAFVHVLDISIHGSRVGPDSVYPALSR